MLPNEIADTTSVSSEPPPFHSKNGDELTRPFDYSENSGKKVTSEHSLPDESPSFRFKDIDELMRQRDPNEINGIVIPQDVKLQLIELGLSLNSYTQGELREANAADANGRVIDDPDGVNWTDKLLLTAVEAAKKYVPDAPDDDDDDDDDTNKGNVRTSKSQKFKPAAKKNYCQMIEEERERKAEALAASENSPDSMDIDI